MGGLETRSVQSRRELGQFVDLPWQIYRDDPNWVPPLRCEVREFLNPKKHPFYLHGAADKAIAVRDGRPVGRILVSDDPRYNSYHGTNTGCFGMFECVDDPPTAHALLDWAAEWLRRRGRTEIMGPVDYSINYPCGLLIEGFDTPPRAMMNHHRPYYRALLESWGLVKNQTLLSWWFLDPHNMVQAWHERALRVARRNRVTIRPFRTDDFDADVARCQQLYNEVGGGQWGYVGLTEAEFQYAARRLRQTGRADLILLAELDGKAVGMSLTIPDINEAIRPLNGRLFRFGLPIGLVQLPWRIRRIKTARMAVLLVAEGYRSRGIAELLILHTLDFARSNLPYTGAELGWTGEDNEAVSRIIRRSGAEPYKRYRVFSKGIGNAGTTG